MPHVHVVPAVHNLAPYYPLVGLVVAIVLLRLAAGLPGGRKVKTFPYRLRDGLLSPAERSFYGVLQTVVEDRYAICPKVRLADLFLVTNGDVSSLNRITSKHADFVLCEPGSMRPVARIELDDSSHQARNRVERDRFVDQVFKTAGLPLLRVPARQGYVPHELQTLVLRAIEGKAADRAISNAPAPAVGGPPECPKCGIPMVLRTAQRGSSRGNQFYGCANYPECRHTEEKRASASG